MELEKVGPYHLKEKLGSGGMGTVFKGEHEETGKLAAVKILNPTVAHEAGFIARFSREVESLRKLSNPHVVEFYESGEQESICYFAMEYVDGETLTQKLRREKRLPWREAIRLGTQICIALKAAHDAGVIHRDLKPSNLLIDQDGNIKLTDFGVAQLFAASKLTVTGGIIGTAEYMSPEQAQGKRVSKKSDIYSLGAVLYVMVAGRPPFRGQTILEVIQKHKYGQFDRPRTLVPEIPHWLDELICQLLEKDPDKRIPDAYVLSRRLQEIVKKVDYSLDEATLALDDRSYDGAAQTVAAEANPSSALGETQPAVSGSSHPSFPHESGGTFMHDMMRAEIEAKQRKSSLEKLLDNVWVLVSLLLMVAFGIYWWWQQPAQNSIEVDPALANAPLSLRDAERDWNRAMKKSEPERLYARAAEQISIGQTQTAINTLRSLQVLVEGEPEYEPLQKAVSRRLTELQEGKNEFLEKQLVKAEQLLDNQKLGQAQGLIASLSKLYADEPRVRKLIEKFNALAKQNKPE